MEKQEHEADRMAIERLLCYMREHCTEPFDVKKHAEHVCFSESKLNKVFKRHVGVGPGTYFRRLRIRKAVELYYREDTRSWTEVSHIVGYADLPSFSKAFKKIIGCTPNAYNA